MKPAAVRRSLRPHGRVAPRCETCLHLTDCGGIEPEWNLFTADCVSDNCCNPTGGDSRQAAACDNVCPNNPKYLDQLRQVGGNLWFESITPVPQAHAQLPRYVPHVYRRYARKVTTNWPVVSLDTYQVVRVEGGKMGLVADDPSSLRQAFGLSADAAVILRGVAADRPLERYWAYRRRDGVPERLARLGIAAAVGPNFSHFLDVPRHDNLFNRKRQLICLAEFAAAGLNPVPHLNAAQPGDWRYWGRFLTDNPTVTVVAAEFETGNRSWDEGQRAVAELRALQQRVGRPLHPLIVGGTQFLESIAAGFVSATFIDSTPFMKTVYRRRFARVSATGKAQWSASPTAPGESLDGLLEHNLREYAAWLDRRWTVTIKSRRADRHRQPLEMAFG